MPRTRSMTKKVTPFKDKVMDLFGRVSATLDEDDDKLEFDENDLDRALDDLLFYTKKCQQENLEQEQLSIIRLLLEKGLLRVGSHHVFNIFYETRGSFFNMHLELEYSVS